MDHLTLLQFDTGGCPAKYSLLMYKIDFVSDQNMIKIS